MLITPRKTVILFSVVLMMFLTETEAQVTCMEPTEIGELRVLKSKKCVDVSGYSGGGNVRVHTCESLDDQRFIICADGTIRSKKANYCLTAKKNGKVKANVAMANCEVYPEIPAHQKWKFGKSKTFVDKMGIQQQAREIINVKSGKCLDVKGTSGTGNIGMYHCEDLDDQYFFIRSRGKLLKHGRLQVQKSGLCLDVLGGSGGKGLIDNNILIYNCENSPDQSFRFYENGELVNDKSQLCVDVLSTSGSGNIIMNYCEGETDQKWSQPYQYCDGSYCAFRNERSGDCMDVSGSQAKANSNVLAYGCDAHPDQRFKWVSGKWSPPTVKWNMVGCNQNGKITRQISNTIRYSEPVTESATLEISSTIEAGVILGCFTFTTTMTASLTEIWEQSQSQTEAITYTCDNYDNGKPFAKGCMWQLEVETKKKAITQTLLQWHPQIVKCTNNHVAPRCPPFTKCKDPECTMCEEMPGILVHKVVR